MNRRSFRAFLKNLAIFPKPALVFMLVAFLLVAAASAIVNEVRRAELQQQSPCGDR